MDEQRLQRYNSKKGAERYDGKFERCWTERLNNWHEQRLFRNLLEDILDSPLERPVLDLPCGTGRLYPLIRAHADRVVESDWSVEMLKKNRENLSSFQSSDTDSDAIDERRNGQRNGSPADGDVFPEGFVRADALDMPFRDRVFDLVVSVRLSHHMPEQEERMTHIREMCRVSAKWVVFTYFEYYSIKNMWREFRRMFVDKRAKWTLQTEDVRRAARSMGFQIERKIPLSPLFSGHRYTVLKRTGAAR